MKNLLLLFSFCFFPILLQSQDIKKVLIIGIDGVRPDALKVAATPNIDKLIDNGLYDAYGLNDDITVSGPGWSAILCGVRSPKHLVTGNDFTVNNYSDYPSFFKRIEDSNPDLHTVSFVNWNPINDHIVLEDADFKLNLDTDEEVSTQAADYLSVNNPDVMFLHFDQVDGAGHSFGFSPDQPEYIIAIEQVDSLLENILQAVENRPDYDNEDWLIIVTTDHGGEGFSHGGVTIEHQNIFMIASGKNIPTRKVDRDSTTVLDQAINCLGDSIELLFDGDDDFVQIANNTLYDFGADRDFTVECRIRTNSSGDYAIIGNKDWNSGLNTGFVFSFKFPSGPEWKLNIGDGSNRVDINTGGEIADNQWHTLGASFDRDGMLKMYQDGVFIDQENMSNIGNITTGEGLFFGTDFNQNFDFPGSIAEVRIWEGIISDAVISSWECKTVNDTHPNFTQLIGHWKLNEGGDLVTAIDHSAEQNNGSIVGAEWTTPDSITIYNYENTSRLVDIPPTVMTHLCIDIEEEWDLDGRALIEECVISSTKQISKTTGFILSPNPAINFASIHSTHNIEEVVIIDLRGTIVKTIDAINRKDYTFRTDLLNNGLYIIGLKANGKKYFKKLVIQNN